MGDNNVPNWVMPDAGICLTNAVMEVGDATEGLADPSFRVRVGAVPYTLTDVAGISWFFDQHPSMEENATYSFDGKLTRRGCPR